MFKLSKSYFLLSLIVVFSFVYRIFLMLRETFPPSADIGLHNSVINSITQTGNTNFLWTYYHMGEGASLTFPGYHIFVSHIMLMTGMPDYLAHSVLSALFSSLIVLVAFLITKKISTKNAALIVAFLVAFSRFDIEMLMWGGYPNVITLLLIPLTFYFVLNREKFSLPSFLIVTSLLSGAIFLTHSLSGIIFVAIIIPTLIFITLFSNRITLRKTQIITYILPLILGAAIVAPFLIQAVPAFLGANKDTFTGGVSDVRLAVLSTQNVAVDFVTPLIFCVLLIFLFSKKHYGKIFSAPAFLLVLWILIPALGSQSAIVGIYTDYNRFRYFVYLPAIITLGLIVDYSSGFLSKTIEFGLCKLETLPKIRKNLKKIILRLRPILSRKNIYAIFVFVFLIYSVSSISIFAVPAEGIKIQSYYQVMDNQLYDAIQWARNSTEPDAVFAADSLYGWWFSGFAQRQTLSAGEPQYLILSREFEPAEKVRNLLDTDYIIDNGFIQIREDGTYIARHNPLFLAKLNNSYFPEGIFHFNSDEVTVLCRKDDNVISFDLSKLPEKDMWIEKDDSSATITTIMGNELFNFSQQVTIYQGIKFANVSITLETQSTNVYLDYVRFIMHTRYAQSFETENSIAIIDNGAKVGGQLVFTKNLPQARPYTKENPSCLELFYNLDGKSTARIELFVGVFQLPYVYEEPKNQTEYLSKLILNNTKFYMEHLGDFPLEVFNYEKFLADWNVSYVICRDEEAIDRLIYDPMFSRVFVNSEVSIFKINRNTN